MARAHQKYWRFNVAWIAALMTIGFFVSFIVPLAAPALDGVRFGGFRLPFYFGAQGAILIYVALIAIYIVLMQRADRRLQRAFDADRDAAAALSIDANVNANANASASAPTNDDSRVAVTRRGY